YALAFPWLVAALEALYPELFAAFARLPPALALVRFLAAFLVLLPPTFLMGASLPAVAQAAGGDATQSARRTAGLYAANTLGGVAGTLLAGFVLLEKLGLVASLRAGAALSATAGLVALVLAACSRTPMPEDAKVAARSDRRAPGLERLALAAALLAGLASLASELVWTRALVFFVHNSTYAFSAIVAVYLLGVATGAALAGRLGRAPAATLRLLAAALLAASASLLLAIAVYRALPAVAELLAGGRRLPPGLTAAADTAALLLWSWRDALLVIFGQVALVLFLPALLLGAVFPLSLRLAPREAAPAEHVGRLYAANALGSVAGTLLGTFVLVATLGTRGALLLVAWLPVPVCLWALRESSPRRRLSPLAASGLVLLLGRPPVSPGAP
ncbi:MAG TPA: fused MFS/spermidine synthase, partial [Vicinamibacteria bacterium]|nr:fused MFS/spermidine synthase [Vicinamibacteria bacterium]